MPILVEIGPVILEKKILNFDNVFLLFQNQGGGPSFEQTRLHVIQG